MSPERDGAPDAPSRPRIPGVHALDVEHDGLPGAICAYLLEGPEPTLVDPGPSTSLGHLRAGLGAVGIGPGELRQVLVTHVHLDHAGGVGTLVRENPHLTVHVHEGGAPHLASPERLVASTRRSFGTAHDRLWGEVLPVPRDRLRGWRPGDGPPLRGIRALPTPGHIDHHLAWEAEGVGVLFAGDAMGIVLGPGVPSHPPTPPPAVDLPAWRETLDRTLAPVEVDAFGSTHFGLHPGLHDRRRELREALDALARRVQRAMEGGEEAEDQDAEAFQRETVETLSRHLPGERVQRYFETFPARADWEGMRFHLARTPEARPGP